MKNRFGLLLGTLVVASCAAGNDDTTGGTAGTGASSQGGQAVGGEQPGVGGGVGGGFSNGGGGSGGFEGTPEVFGHSSTVLYKLNPVTKDVGIVGTFSGCTDIVDLALDEASHIYVTTQDGLYTVDKDTADCTLIAEGSYPNSLSFVPAGTLDPSEEALVGFLDDQYVRIDTTSGEMLNVGAPWNNAFVSSGDVVSVKNGPTYLTIKDADPNDDVCDDCLVEINPATGVIIKDFHSVGYSKVFGAAFWAGSIYGFTNDGQIFEIQIENNELTTIPIATPDGLSFWGAGSTTSAPPAPQ